MINSISIACKNLIFKNIQAIIFDKDGTLENSRAYWYEVGIRRIEAIEVQIPGIKSLLLQILNINSGKIDSTGLMAVGSRQENEIAMAAAITATGKSWFESREIAKEAIVTASSLTKTVQSSPLYPDTEKFLRQLSSVGLKIAIISADSTQGVEEFMERHQLTNYIRVAIGSDRGISKPDPQLIIKACEILAVKPENIMAIGDSSADMAMAKAALVAASIGINWEDCGKNQLINADLTIANWSEIQIVST
jgi:phosphoglycolate phosphatase